MNEAEQLLNQPLTDQEIAAAVLVSATEFATRALSSAPGAAAEIAAGAGAEVVVTLRPAPSVWLRTVRPGGERVPVSGRNFEPAGTPH